MEQRLSAPRPRGFDRNALRMLGLAIMTLGMLGRGIIQGRVLGMASGAVDLAQLLDSTENAMSAATAAIVLQALEAMAVPIFAVLTVDGFRNTSSVKRYLLRLILLALVSEIPFHLACTGRVWQQGAQSNPVWGLVLSVVMMYLMKSFPKSILVKVLSPLAAMLWVMMLNVEYGGSMVLLCFVLYLCGKRQTLAYLVGTAAALLCTVGNPMFLFAPFGFLPAHMYNETQRPMPRLLTYSLYPIMLMLIYVASLFLF